MKKTKITRNDFRKMVLGVPMTFTDMEPNNIESARTSAYQMGRLMNCKFTVSADYDARTVTITKEER